MSTQLIVAIEGVGIASANQMLLFANGAAPSWDTAGAWRQVLTTIPSELASSVNFRDGGATIGGLSVELTRGEGVPAYLYEQRRVQIATLTAAQAYGDTTITLDKTTLANTPIVVGREVQRLGAHSGGGVYAVSRQLLQTTKEAHGVALTDNVAVYNADKVPYIKHRRLFLYRCNMDTAITYSSLELLYTGVISGVSAPSPDRIRIDSDALFTLAGELSFYRKRFEAVVNPGRSDITPRRYVALGEGREPIAVSPALFAIDEGAILKDEYGFTGTGITVIGFSEDDLYSQSVQELPSTPGKIHEVFHCTAPTGFAPSSLPLSSNLLTLLLQITLTTSHGNNSSYDLGIDGLGIGLPQSYVDVSGIEALRDRLGGELLEQPRLFVGLKNEPERFIEYFKPRLIAYGLALVSKANKLSLALLKDSGARNLPTLVEGVDLLGPSPVGDYEPPIQARRLDMGFDRVECEFGLLPGRGTIKDTFIDRRAIDAHPYGGGGSTAVNLEGVTDRATAQALCIDLIQRFHFEIPEVRVRALRSRADLEIGDLVAVTHSKIYKGTGGELGVSGAVMLITERALNLSDNTIEFVLYHVGALYDRVGDIAPAAVVTSYPGGQTVNVAQDAAGGGFQSGGGSAPGDTDLISVNDKCDIVTSEGVVRQANLQVQSKTATSITFNAPLSITPVAGDVVRFTSYDNQQTGQRDFASIADTTPSLGTAGDTPYEYTGF
jgi:hypothetical protein